VTAAPTDLRRRVPVAGKLQEIHNRRGAKCRPRVKLGRYCCEHVSSELPPEEDMLISALVQSGTWFLRAEGLRAELFGWSKQGCSPLWWTVGQFANLLGGSEPPPHPSRSRA
jgi:hypothetical protein